MRRLVHFLAQLYPASWRSRYQVEFNALLEDVNPTWRTSLNVLAGAMAMHLRTSSSWKIVASSSFIGMLLGLGIWLTLPNQYSSQATIELDPPDRNLFTARAKAALTRSILANIIQKEKLYPSVQGKMPLESLVSQMRKSIEFQRVEPNSVAIQFKYGDPALAQRATGDLVEEIFERSITDCHGHLCLPLTIRLYEAPTLPKSPLSPNPAPFTFAGLFTGLIAGSLLDLFRKSRRPVI